MPIDLLSEFIQIKGYYLAFHIISTYFKFFQSLSAFPHWHIGILAHLYLLLHLYLPHPHRIHFYTGVFYYIFSYRFYCS